MTVDYGYITIIDPSLFQGLGMAGVYNCYNCCATMDHTWQAFEIEGAV